MHPYLRPLYDALYDMLEPEKGATLTEQGAIEIAPLAYMRGRTLNDAFIILDEAQNTTSEQMKMFLTRLGFNSQAWSSPGTSPRWTCPRSRPSGLIEIQSVLKASTGIRFIYFTRGRRAARARLGDRARLRRVEPAARDVIVVANRQSAARRSPPHPSHPPDRAPRARRVRTTSSA